MRKRTNLLILLGLALALNATAQTEPTESPKSKQEQKKLKRARRNSTDEYKGRVAEQVRFTDDAPTGKKQRKEDRKRDVTSAKIDKKHKSK